MAANLHAAEQLIGELHQLAETCLYDADHDQALPGYEQLHSIARTLAARPTQDMLRLRIAAELDDMVTPHAANGYSDGWHDAARFVRDSTDDDALL